MRFLWKQPVAVWLLSLQGQFPVFATVFRVFQTFVMCYLPPLLLTNFKRYMFLYSPSLFYLSCEVLVVISVKKTCLKHTNLQVSLCWKLQIGDRKCLSKRPGSVVNKTRVYQHRDNTKTLRVWDQVETEKGRDSRDFESRNQHDHLYSTRVIHFFCVFWFSEWLLSSSKNILKYRILQLLSSLQLRSRLLLKNKILRFSPIESKNAIESTMRPRPSKSRTILPLRASWTISTLIDSETLLNSGLLSVKKKLLPSG